MIIVKLTYNREYEQRTNNIDFSILRDLEILGRPNWESTQLTSIGTGPLNGPYKVWLMPWVHPIASQITCEMFFNLDQTSNLSRL